MIRASGHVIASGKVFDLVFYLTREEFDAMREAGVHIYEATDMGERLPLGFASPEQFMAMFEGARQ